MGRKKRKKGDGGDSKGPKFTLPGDEEVAVAVLRAMQERGPFKSQRQFRDAVIVELHVADPKATVGASRLRQIALRGNIVHLELDYREGGETAHDTCPVCGASLRKVRNRTLNRKTVVTGFECPRCVYRTDSERMNPARYQFSPRRL